MISKKSLLPVNMKNVYNGVNLIPFKLIWKELTIISFMERTMNLDVKRLSESSNYFQPNKSEGNDPQINLGIIFSLSLVFRFSVNMDPKYGWPITGFFYILLSIITLIMVIEP